MPAAAAEESQSWKQGVPKSIQVVTATPQFLTFKYERTPYVKAKVTFTFPENYPAVPLIVTLEQLPPGLIKKLMREMEDVAKAHLSKPQIQPVAQHLTNFLDTNLFVPCWKELRKIVDQAKDSNTLSIGSLQETKGAIRFQLTNGEYAYEGKMMVNPGYPSTTNLDDPLQLQTMKSNFPKHVLEMVVEKQVKNFLRNMQDGMKQENAWLKGNPIKHPDQPADTPNDGDPIPSLLPLVSILQTKLQALPATNCPMCQTPVLPKDPKQLAKLKKPHQPTYSSCGCWYHHQCLDQSLSEPPFGESCPACRRNAYHPDWASDEKERQQAYAQKQARQREMDDVADMF